MGNVLDLSRYVRLKFKIAGTIFKHKIYLVDNFSLNDLLESDFSKCSNCKMHFERKLLTLQNFVRAYHQFKTQDNLKICNLTYLVLTEVENNIQFYYVMPKRIYLRQCSSKTINPLKLLYEKNGSENVLEPVKSLMKKVYHILVPSALLTSLC